VDVRDDQVADDLDVFLPPVWHGDDVVAAPPPSDVLVAFGVRDRPAALPGGRGTSWRAGATVLKPLDMPQEALAWQDQVLRAIPTVTAFRVAAPVRSADGRLVVSGWTAWAYLEGRHQPGRWPEIVAAGRLFHAATGCLPRPGFLSERTDWWAAGDRVAWGESPIQPYEDLDTIRALTAALRPVEARPQLIHGDLTGNVLFHQDLPPAVIDLSPYWRPRAFADAVVVADALCWEGAGADLVAAVSVGTPEFGQCFVRALIYRIVTDRLAGGERTHDWQAPYRPAVRIACAIAATS
jgi:uncharacterized protein (TIGR02569 family)